MCNGGKEELYILERDCFTRKGTRLRVVLLDDMTFRSVTLYFSRCSRILRNYFSSRNHVSTRNPLRFCEFLQGFSRMLVRESKMQLRFYAKFIRKLSVFQSKLRNKIAYVFVFNYFLK